MCNCNKGEKWVVTLATGTKVEKRGSEDQVKRFTARHKGAKYEKKAS